MFETMITPILMTFIYYLGSAGIVIGTGYAMLTGYYGYEWFPVLVAGALSLLVWRITCEFIVVRFRIYEVLTEIRNHGPASRSSQTGIDLDHSERKEPKIREWVRDNNLSDFEKE